MRQSLLALLPVVMFAAACDADGDGLTDAQEAKLGLDPDVADTDGDGLLDGEEVNTIGTDPAVADTDGDEANDSEEIAAGTDPMNPDMDGDGVLDGVEIANGSDPFDKAVWPWRAGIWPDYSADAPDSVANAQTFAVGEPLPRFRFGDQFGETVNSHQFYGNVILLDLSAGWCSPCRAVAETAQEAWRDIRGSEGGFVIIHAMIDGNGNVPADLPFRQEWAEQYGIKFPVGGEGNIRDKLLEGLRAANIYEGGIPFMVLLDQEHNIVNGYTGGNMVSQVEAEARDLLGR